MNRRTLTIALAATMTMAAAVSMACPFCKTKKSGMFIGEAVLMGNGTARAWADIEESGKPRAIGVTFNELALENLPAQTDAKMPPEFTLQLPKQVKDITAFDHVAINWNPNGHPPKEIYGPEHFDFHFYTIPTTERSQITLKDENMKLCKTKPEPKLMPAGYIYAPDSEEPYMGAHWVDLSSPEFQGKPFTSSFLYGSFNGKVIHYEPMITKAMFKPDVNFASTVKLPEEFVQSGYYPTEYTITYDEKRREYTVALTKFVERKSNAELAAMKLEKAGK